MSAPFRYIVLVKTRQEVTPSLLDEQLEKLDDIMSKGPLSYRLERDLKLQPGTADYALIINFNSTDELQAWNAPSIEHAAMKRLAGGFAENVMVLAHRCCHLWMAPALQGVN